MAASKYIQQSTTIVRLLKLSSNSGIAYKPVEGMDNTPVLSALRDGRVYPVWRRNVHGRWLMHKPDLGHLRCNDLHRALVADDGYQFVAVSYRHLDLACLSETSHDPVLSDDLRHDDIVSALSEKLGFTSSAVAQALLDFSRGCARQDDDLLRTMADRYTVSSSWLAAGGRSTVLRRERAGLACALGTSVLDEAITATVCRFPPMSSGRGPDLVTTTADGAIWSMPEDDVEMAVAYLTGVASGLIAGRLPGCPAHVDVRSGSDFTVI